LANNLDPVGADQSAPRVSLSFFAGCDSFLATVALGAGEAICDGLTDGAALFIEMHTVRILALPNVGAELDEGKTCLVLGGTCQTRLQKNNELLDWPPECGCRTKWRFYEFHFFLQAG